MLRRSRNVSNTMNNVTSQADSNVIASFNLEIPWNMLSRLFGFQLEKNGYFGANNRDSEWQLCLINESYSCIRLELKCNTVKDYLLPTLYFNLKFGGTSDKPLVCEKGEISCINIPSRRIKYTYGTSQIFCVASQGFQNSITSFIQNEKLLINLTLYTLIGILEVNDANSDATQVHEIRLLHDNISIGNDFSNLLKNSKFSDVEIVCGGESLKAHKCILAARSKTFSKLLETATDKITIPDVDVSVMKLVLQYIYSADANLLENELIQDNLIEVLHCADKYDLGDLKTLCFNRMRKAQ